MGSSLWAGQSPSLPPAPKPGNKDFPLPPTPPSPPPGPSRWGEAAFRSQRGSFVLDCSVRARGCRASLLGQVASGLRGCVLVIKGGPRDVLGARAALFITRLWRPATGLWPQSLRPRLAPSHQPPCGPEAGVPPCAGWKDLAGLLAQGSHAIGGSATPNPGRESGSTYSRLPADSARHPRFNNQLRAAITRTPVVDRVHRVCRALC